MKAEILPLKTAAEVWAQSGPDMWLDRWTREGLAQLQGKGPRCAMTAAEYWEYERQRKGDAAVISMRVVTWEEEVEALNARLRPSCFAASFREIEQLLLAHQSCLVDDEQDEIIRQLGAKLLPLKEAVLRAEELWLENLSEVTLRAERDHEAERANEAVTKLERIVGELDQERAENARLRQLLDQKAGVIISDLSAKLESETMKLLSGMAPVDPVCDNCGDPATCTGYHEFAGYVHSCASCAETQGRDKELTQIRPLPKTGGPDAA